MKPDDFEQKLGSQPLRQLPPEWRDEIFSAAQAAAARTARQNVEEDSVSLWRLIFARFPIAWGALAAIWIVVIGVNSLIFSTGGSPMSQPAIAATPEPFSIWQLQVAERRQLANDQNTSDPSMPGDLPQALPPRPRSQRQLDSGFGELNSECDVSRIA